MPYQNSGVLWTYELILGVLETSDYSVYAQYRSWVLYLDTRAALGGAQITISAATNYRPFRDSIYGRQQSGRGKRGHPVLGTIIYMIQN